MSSWRKKRSVMRRYDLTSQMYDERYQEEQEAKYSAALNGLDLPHSSSVLDVGCGSGLLFPRLTGKVKLLVGVDASRGLLELAKKRIKAKNKVQLVLADADYLPFTQGVFSHVFAFTILQNMPKPAETLKRLKLVAKVRACFVVTGLKAAIPLETLGAFLEDAKLKAVFVADNEALKCYIVRATSR